MKKQLIFSCLLACALQANAGSSDCAAVGTRLNDMASDDQQIRQEWNTLEHDSKAVSAEKDILKKALENHR